MLEAREEEEVDDCIDELLREYVPVTEERGAEAERDHRECAQNERPSGEETR